VAATAARVVAAAATGAAVVEVAGRPRGRHHLTFNHRDRWRHRAWLARRPDPRSSWAMLRRRRRRRAAGARAGAGGAARDRAWRRPGARCLRWARRRRRPDEALRGAGRRRRPRATEVTGDVYGVQSGRWWRLFGVQGTSYHFLKRTGGGQDFHAGTVCAKPGGRLIMFRPATVVLGRLDHRVGPAGRGRAQASSGARRPRRPRGWSRSPASTQTYAGQSIERPRLRSGAPSPPTWLT
jgi:hypothetical protein